MLGLGDMIGTASTDPALSLTVQSTVAILYCLVRVSSEMTTGPIREYGARRAICSCFANTALKPSAGLRTRNFRRTNYLCASR